MINNSGLNKDTNLIEFFKYEICYIVVQIICSKASIIIYLNRHKQDQTKVSYLNKFYYNLQQKK